MDYFLYIAGAVVAVFNHVKDWSAHKTFFRRWTVLILIILIGIGGVVNSYLSDDKNRRQHEEDQKEIANARDNLKKVSQELSFLKKDVKQVGLAIGELVKQGKITKKDAVVILSGIEAVASAGKIQVTVNDETTSKAK